MESKETQRGNYVIIIISLLLMMTFVYMIQPDAPESAIIQEFVEIQEVTNQTHQELPVIDEQIMRQQVQQQVYEEKIEELNTIQSEEESSTLTKGDTFLLEIDSLSQKIEIYKRNRK